MLLIGYVSWSSAAVNGSAGGLYIVGGSSGWATGVDYNAWASGKTFLVGNVLGMSLFFFIYMIYNSIYPIFPCT